jgi:hypothetical protein
MRGRRSFLVVSWCALAIWAGLWAYVAGTNRWGVFAIAPALLPMLACSAALTLVGGVMVLARMRHGRADASLIVVVLLHGAIVWYAATQQ